MGYTNYIIFILLLVLVLSVFLYKNTSTKETLMSNAGTFDTKRYDDQISKLTDRYNFLMGRVPIKFYAGNVEYSYNTDVSLPLVVFTGGVPYINVNMRLPYPAPGDNGDPGNPGPPGIPGSQGIQGNSGLSGYSGSSYSDFLDSNVPK